MGLVEVASYKEHSSQTLSRSLTMVLDCKDISSVMLIGFIRENFKVAAMDCCRGSQTTDPGNLEGLSKHQRVLPTVTAHRDAALIEVSRVA